MNILFYSSKHPVSEPNVCKEWVSSTRSFFRAGPARPEALLPGRHEGGGSERQSPFLPFPSFRPQTTTGCAFDPDLPRAKPEMSKAMNGGGGAAAAKEDED